jgi:hypothetical protein
MTKKKPEPALRPTEEQLIQELAALENDQQRIDRVAEDFESGKYRYDEIGAWKLAELLGLDFNDTGDWDRTFWGEKMNLYDLWDSHPYADHLELIEGQIPRERYEELAKMVEAIQEAIQEDEEKPDLPLTKKEIRLLEKAYSDSETPDCSDVTVATTTITSSGGVELQFEVCIGDGGEPYDPQSPYDGGFDSSDYMQVY